MSDSNTMTPIQVGLDDGYAFTKVALPDGRLIAIPSRARVGKSGVTWIHDGQQRIFEYETEGAVYSVGAVDGAPTHFEGYPTSGMNRAIVQHALQEAGLAGRSVHAVSGLPVSAFYKKNGEQRRDTIEKKRLSLKQAVQPKTERLPAAIAFHEVIPEALAAWYDYVIVAKGNEAILDEARLSVPIAIVDIGGRTTDYVVVKDQGVSSRVVGFPAGRHVGRETTGGRRHPGTLRPRERGRAAGVIRRRTRRRASARQGSRCRGTGGRRQAGAGRTALCRDPPTTRPGCGTGPDTVRWRRHRRAGGAYRRLVSQPGHRRTSGLRQRARDAEVSAIRLRRVGRGLTMVLYVVTAVSVTNKAP